MKIHVAAGKNLYRVQYKELYVHDLTFSRLVVAASATEACYLVNGCLKVELVEEDISMWVPDKYCGEINIDK